MSMSFSTEITSSNEIASIDTASAKGETHHHIQPTRFRGQQGEDQERKLGWRYVAFQSETSGLALPQGMLLCGAEVRDDGVRG